jgi:hypothetical protein
MTEGDIAALQATEIPVMLDGATGLQLLSAMQLALRHPGFTGPAAQTVQKFAVELALRLSVTDNLTKICGAGFDESYEFQVEEPERRRIILPGE